jgi:hypothetical protein
MIIEQDWKFDKRIAIVKMTHQRIDVATGQLMLMNEIIKPTTQ